jgi:hypothetical protein
MLSSVRMQLGLQYRYMDRRASAELVVCEPETLVWWCGIHFARISTKSLP